jgi:hypothetical protein
MRVFGALFIAILLAMAAVLYLQREDTEASLRAVSSVAADLREDGVSGRALDPEMAARMVDSLQELVDHPEEIRKHVDDLKTVTTTAAAWAAAAPSPSTDLRIAVSLRGAAGDLRSHGIQPSEMSLASARRNLQAARGALAGDPVGTAPTDAVRDRLENLQRSQQERYQDVEEELNR